MGKREDGILVKACYKYDISLEQLKGHRISKSYVTARRECVSILLSMGYGYSEIGRLMNRSHGAIWHMVNRKRKK